jgi:hypothetical protein
VDFATAASQNGSSIQKLSLHKEANLITKMTKAQYPLLYNFCILSLISCEKRSFFDTFAEIFKGRFVTQPLQNTPSCISTLCEHTLHVMYMDTV